MKLLITLIVILATVAIATSNNNFPNPRGWIHQGVAPLEAPTTVVFAIRQRNLQQLEEYVNEISNPRSPIFGRHLTLAQVGEMTADREATEAIMKWLHSSGVPQSEIDGTINGELLRVRMPVQLANRLLQTQLHQFNHPDNHKNKNKKPRAPIFRASSYALPQQVAMYVEFVSGVKDFPRARSPPATARSRVDIVNRAGSTSDPFPPGFTYPGLLFNYYNISNPVVATATAEQSVFETLGQSYTPSDLSGFQQTMNVTVQAIAKVIGPNDANSCATNPDNCAEASLDVQYIMAVAQGAPTIFWSIPSSDQQPYLDFLIALGKNSNPPYVHSISYGDVEQFDDPSLMNRFNDEAMKLAARGLTIVVASGDDGVANFLARGNASACGFNPAFPASAIYATAVGATQGPENSSVEIACTSSTGGGITTGGGFSNVFNQPSYQSAAVSNYLNSAQLPPSGMYNSAGRGYPDVSMMGHNYIVADGGQFTAGSGTSASAPVFAALVTLANGARLSQGKSALGFMNNILYQMASTTPSAFHDITSGENNCAAGDVGTATCCQYGFYAAPGWDPLTGLGSINFPVFLNYLMNL